MICIKLISILHLASKFSLDEIFTLELSIYMGNNVLPYKSFVKFICNEPEN